MENIKVVERGVEVDYEEEQQKVRLLLLNSIRFVCTFYVLLWIYTLFIAIHIRLRAVPYLLIVS